VADVPYKYYNGVYFRKEKTLKRADHFGELALMSERDNTRNATCICETSVVLAVLGREDFRKALNRI